MSRVKYVKTKLREYFYRLKSLRQPYDIINSLDFAGKTVVLIGPAEIDSQLIQKYAHEDVIIVSINRVPILYSQKFQTIRKIDLWIHSFDEDPVTGGGALTRKNIIDSGCQKLVCPISPGIYDGNFYKILSRKLPVKVCRFSSQFSRRLQNGYPANIPTVGYFCLAGCLNSKAKEVVVTGFTFMRTNYSSGYRNGYEEPQSALNLAEGNGQHDIRWEEKSFFRLCDDVKIKPKVILDRTLQDLKGMHFRAK